MGRMLHLALNFILFGLCLSNAQDAQTQQSQQNPAQGQSPPGGYPFPHQPYYGYSGAAPPHAGWQKAGGVPNQYAPAPVAAAGGMIGNEMLMMMMMMQQNQMEQQMLLLMMNGGMGGAGGMGGNNMMLFYLMMMMKDEKRT